jgi:hypothetical protein
VDGANGKAAPLLFRADSGFDSAKLKPSNSSGPWTPVETIAQHQMAVRRIYLTPGKN